MKLYLAGPMTNYPQFNYPAFHAAAAKLRAAGNFVISPAEQDPEGTQKEAMASSDGKVHSESYGSMMARDVRIVIDDVDGIVFLPGWQNSRGARIEAFVGISCGKWFGLYDEHFGDARLMAVDELWHKLKQGIALP